MSDRDELAAVIRASLDVHWYDLGEARCYCGEEFGGPVHEADQVAALILARWRLVPVERTEVHEQHIDAAHMVADAVRARWWPDLPVTQGIAAVRLVRAHCTDHEWVATEDLGTVGTVYDRTCTRCEVRITLAKQPIPADIRIDP